jgi:hypothetical protein
MEIKAPSLSEVFGWNKTETWAVVGEFASPEELVHAGREVRRAGFTKLDALSPFPIHGIDDAIGNPRSHLGWIVIIFSVLGAGAALLLQWYTNAGPTLTLPWWSGFGSYPIVVGGKPYFDLTYAIPITFELTVLLSAFATVLGMFALNGLPSLYHPFFRHSQAHRATDDRFFLAVEATDPKFQPEQISNLMKSLGALSVEVVEG